MVRCFSKHLQTVIICITHKNNSNGNRWTSNLYSSKNSVIDPMSVLTDEMPEQLKVLNSHQQQENMKRKSGGHPSPPSLSQQLPSQKSGGRSSLSSLSCPLAPQLARGVQPGGEVNLDIFSPPSARRLDPAKASSFVV